MIHPDTMTWRIYHLFLFTFCLLSNGIFIIHFCLLFVCCQMPYLSSVLVYVCLLSNAIFIIRSCLRLFVVKWHIYHPFLFTFCLLSNGIFIIHFCLLFVCCQMPYLSSIFVYFLFVVKCHIYHPFLFTFCLLSNAIFIIRSCLRLFVVTAYMCLVSQRLLINYMMQGVQLNTAHDK